MYPPIFKLCADNEKVTALLGTNPTRFYLFGLAPQDVARPYVVWQTIGGEPENYLGNRPDVDYFDIQINVYARSASEAIAVVKAIRDALEDDAYITRWGGDDRDPNTKDFVYTFDIEFITQRND